MAQPKRTEIWRVRFEPGVGAEIGKTRPALVLSPSTVGRLALSIVVPITAWQEAFEDRFWMVPIEPDDMNGLTKPSAIDCFQIHCFSHGRFLEYLGSVTEETAEAVVTAVALCIQNSESKHA